MGYTVFPMANGNWSTAANWSGGVVPTLDDDVYLNGKTVTADQNMECYTVRNDAVRAILPNMEIPTMVNNTSQLQYSGTLATGTANASSNTITAWQAFASPSSATFWTSASNNTGWVSYQFTTGKVIKRYYIGDAGTAGARPKDWTFEGSNDGSSWTTLDTVSGAASAAYTSGALANTTSYTYYRINITAVQTLNTPPRVTRFEMTESTSTNYSTTTGGNLTISTAYNLTIAESFRTLTTSTFLTISASSGTINLTSNSGFITRDGYSSAINGLGIAISGNGVTVNTSGVINSNTYGGLSTCSFIGISGAAIVNHTGDVNSFLSISLAATQFLITNANATLTINGNLIGGLNNNLTSGSLAHTIYSTIGATIIINGNVTGGLNEAINLTSAASNLTINGNCTAYNATTTGRGAAISSAGNVLLNGTATNINGVNAIYSRNIKLKSTTSIVWTFQDELGNNKILYSAGAGSGVGMPSQANVRQGIIYGAASELTGTLIVPSAANVRNGVPFDNTVGTGDLTSLDFWNTLLSVINTSGSVGKLIKDNLDVTLSSRATQTSVDNISVDVINELTVSNDDIAVRLRNVSTVETTAATIAAYNS